MIGSLILFVLFILVYVIISDVITVLFRLTGLTEERARFQVISLLTNSGFTTAESEVIVNSKLRRTLAKATMVFGYAFTVTIMSTLVNIFMSLEKKQLNTLLFILPTLAVLVVLFTILRKSKRFRLFFDHQIEKMACRLFSNEHNNVIMFIDDYGDLVVARILLNRLPPNLDGIPLGYSGVKQDYGINIMTIKSEDGRAKPAFGASILKRHDVIMVLGTKRKIHDLFGKGYEPIYSTHLS